MTPERFNELLLDYLYDLLDEAEARAVREHVAAHPEAQAQVERARGLLAGAARYEFPAVRFAAPAAEGITAPAPRAPVASPATATPQAGRSWVPWAVAAGVLIALGAIGYPVSQHLIDYNQARNSYDVAQGALDSARHEREQTVAQRNRELTDANAKIEQKQKEFGEVQTGYVKQLDDLQKEAAKREMVLQVTGPPAIQAGAPNTFHIATVSKDNQTPVSSKLNLRVTDQNDNILFEEKDVHSLGRYILHLPPDLPFKPDTSLKLDVTASSEGKVRDTLNEQLPWAPPRYVTHVATDKPMYQPGQTVYFRSLTLNRANLRPPEENFHIVFTITRPSGAEAYKSEGETRLLRLVNDKTAQAILGPDAKPVRGIGVGEFSIPEHFEGGEYVLSVREVENRFPEEKRKFMVNKYTPDRINKELDFNKKTYGPGEEVIANLKVAPAEAGGNVASIHFVRAVATVDKLPPIEAALISAIDPLGRCRVRFVLPKQIDEGKVSLSATFRDNAAVESIQKPVPVVIKKLFVEFFPEGGDLIAGVPNRVYFQAKNNLDKPADLKGRLLDSHGAEVARAQTFNDDLEAGANQGLGVFTFTPQKDEKYELKIDEPAGIEKTVALLSKTVNLKTDGVALMVPTGVTEEGQPIRVELRGTEKAREMLVGAYSRGRLLDQQAVRVEPGQATVVELKPAESVGGVVRITAFEKREVNGGRASYDPRAERLVYRKSPQAVKFAIEPGKKRYGPGDTVSLIVSATDEKGNPARAVALVSVVDQTVVTMADEKTARSLPTHFGLAGEIRKAEDLEHADFLLTDHPKAPIALDLLLGVQGWRRFAEQNPVKFRQEQKEPDMERLAERLIVLEGASGQRDVNILSFKFDELNRNFATKAKSLQDELTIAFEEDQNVQKRQEEFTKSLQEKDAAVREKQAEAQAALVAVRSYDEARGEFRRSTMPLLVGAAMVLALGLVIIGALRGARRGIPFHVAAAASLTAGIVLLIGSSTLEAPASRDGANVAVAESRSAPPANRRFADATAPQALPAAPGGAEPAMRDAPRVAMPEMRPAAPAPPGPVDMADPKQRDELQKELEQKRPLAATPPGAPKPIDGVRLQMERFAGDKKKADERPDFRAPRGMAKDQPMAKGELEQKDVGDRARRAGVNVDAQVKAREAMKRAMNQNAVAGGAMARADFAKGAGLPPGAGAGGMMPGGMGIPGPGGPGGLGGGAGPGMGGGGRAFGGAGGFGGGFPGGGPGGPAPVLDMPVQPPPEPFLFREFAHSSKLNEETRSEFTETVYWNPVVVLDESGKKTVTFQLGDSITSYRVLVAGHTLDGRLGQATQLIESRKAFNLQTKLPAEMTASDRLDLPLQIINDSDDQRTAKIDVDAKNFKIEAGSASDRLVLGPNERSRRVVSLRPSVLEGDAGLKVTGTSEPLARDGVERGIHIVPDGFPAIEGKSDLLEKVARHEFVLPKDFVKGSLKVRAQIYPSTLADLQQGLAALLREPGGCFEQTSSSNYPNTLILNYIKESGEKAPEVVKRAEGMLDRGYQKLVSFECQKSSGGREGYEWFGGMAPPHEALTAYGLLEFKDMANVRPVDQEMLERTRKYLLSRRLPGGGFMRNAAAIDTFGRAPQHITDAYIIWALSEAGKEDLGKDIDKLLKDHADSSDPYFLSLIANALLNVGDGNRGVELLKKVRAKQAADGGLDGAETSITASGGRDLRIETTALAVLGWLKANRPADFTEPLNKAIRWVSQQRGGHGGFGSTQSTILALKALIAFTKANKKTAEAGDLTLFAGNQVIGRTHFEAGAKDAVTVEVTEPEKFFKPGKNDLRLEVSKGSYPYTIAWSYSALTPVSAEQCSVRLSTKLDKQQANEGDGVRLTATLENVAGKGLPMTVAIIGLPAGLKVPEDMKQLKEMAALRKTGPNGELEAGEISFFELRGRELVLYWRDVKPGAKMNLAIDLIAEIPGEFRGPASRAYLYYNADHKHWIEPLSIAIAPAK